MTQYRSLQRVINARDTADGDGVKIRRIAGRDVNAQLDPFLLLDEMNSEDGADYIGGFPSHPHRGFETITYMLDGAMRHRDHLGNEGVISSGGVQWMTAGAGVIHSEMPEQTEGLLHGFQLWLNLPASEKMQPAAYQEYASDQIPVLELGGGSRIKVIAGAVPRGVTVVTGPVAENTTRATYLDVDLQAGASWELKVDPTQTVLLLVFEGSTTELQAGQLGIYHRGDALAVRASGEGARALLLAATPLREPIAQYGPFVMNTQAEIEQAISDYNEGRFVA
ncbi:pirin family protein [Halieaceae bacterium IMCC14734]|uniref:Pirin family protein n=1 Tax=Candidatus Litorirhabdus singularis TaxID=2518993 RepID=A0ABT3TC55_9GAMM|nr:pirin family protein [Candidatus Litorirhabdus singularis]MCX2979594.1 pirin family protein [Candidatus Litorirhabdus singularis]